MKVQIQVTGEATMGELRERLWAVISERGCEASGLEHAEAARLTRELASHKISGLCVVTTTTAGRLAVANASASATREAAATQNGKPALNNNSADSSAALSSKKTAVKTAAKTSGRRRKSPRPAP